MKKLILFLKYALMTKRNLLIKTSNRDFSELEQSVIGDALIRRFETMEDLTVECEKILG